MSDLEIRWPACWTCGRDLGGGDVCRACDAAKQADEIEREQFQAASAAGLAGRTRDEIYD